MQREIQSKDELFIVEGEGGVQEEGHGGARGGEQEKKGGGASSKEVRFGVQAVLGECVRQDQEQHGSHQQLQVWSVDQDCATHEGAQDASEQLWPI